MANIINRSLKKVIFPDKLKKYKREDPCIFVDYRPISLLSILSNFVERVMYIYVIYPLGGLCREKKNCARGREYGQRPQTEGTAFPYIDRPKPVNNVFISYAFFSENEHGKLVCKMSFYALYVALSQLKFNFNSNSKKRSVRIT